MARGGAAAVVPSPAAARLALAAWVPVHCCDAGCWRPLIPGPAWSWTRAGDQLYNDPVFKQPSLQAWGENPDQ